MSFIKTGAKGSYKITTPLADKLKGLVSIKADSDERALHKLIGGIHRKRQKEQMQKASWSK